MIASAGSKYSALIDHLLNIGYTGPVQQEIQTLIEALMRRGLADGTFRDDLTVEELVLLFGSLLEAAGRLAAEHRAGVEQAAALVTSFFLHGAARR